METQSWWEQAEVVKTVSRLVRRINRDTEALDNLFPKVPSGMTMPLTDQEVRHKGLVEALEAALKQRDESISTLQTEANVQALKIVRLEDRIERLLKAIPTDEPQLRKFAATLSQEPGRKIEGIKAIRAFAEDLGMFCDLQIAKRIYEEA